jgi:hypothetical protein
VDHSLVGPLAQQRSHRVLPSDNVHHLTSHTAIHVKTTERIQREGSAVTVSSSDIHTFSSSIGSVVDILMTTGKKLEKINKRES